MGGGKDVHFKKLGTFSQHLFFFVGFVFKWAISKLGQPVYAAFMMIWLIHSITFFRYTIYKERSG